MPKVIVVNMSGRPVRRSLLLRAARRALAAERRRVPVEIAVVDGRAMRRLHKASLGLGAATDVLAYPRGPGGPADHIAVCRDVAWRESRRRGHALHAELALYVVHGILHLAGHDDHASRARARMWARQAEILRGLGLRLGS